MKVDKDRLVKVDKWAATLGMAGRQVKKVIEEFRLLMIENRVLKEVSKKKDEEIEYLKSELEWIENRYKEEKREDSELVIH